MSLHLDLLAQTTNTAKKTVKDSGLVTFIARVDATQATKDGIYVNGYVVNLSYRQIKKLNGKKIKITGKVTIVKGIKMEPQKDAVQGREADTKYIGSPKIETIRKGRSMKRRP